ncbi:MAG: hypothetical protein NVS3B7_03340 [Candidatus Elarobacter sp.]
MEYVEMLRARRVLTWYGGIIFTVVSLGLIFATKDGAIQAQMAHDRNPMIPFDAILVGAAYGPLIIAAFLAVGLDAEYKTTAIAWTRPLSRLVIAARYIAVDLGTMVAAWLIAILAAVIPIFMLGINKYFVFSTNLLHEVLIAFACAVMWYGLIVFFSALMPLCANVVVGISWAYALIVPGLAQIPFPTPVHVVLVALTYLDPLAYLGHDSVTVSSDTTVSAGTHSTIAGSGNEHVVAAFLIGLAAIAIGTRIWSTREVPA